MHLRSAIDCLPILPPTNGTVEFSNNSTTYLAVASFFCEEGYELNGASNRTCLANGNWSSFTPDCDIIGMCMLILLKFLPK